MARHLVMPPSVSISYRMSASLTPYCGCAALILLMTTAVARPLQGSSSFSPFKGLRYTTSGGAVVTGSVAWVVASVVGWVVAAVVAAVVSPVVSSTGFFPQAASVRAKHPAKRKESTLFMTDHPFIFLGAAIALHRAFIISNSAKKSNPLFSFCGNDHHKATAIRHWVIRASSMVFPME